MRTASADDRKSYAGFIAWLVLFCVGLLGIGLLPISDADVLMRLMDNGCCWGIVALTLIIERTEKVYWYNGITFEEAQAAGSERRKRYARALLKPFLIFAVLFSVFSAAGQFLQLAGWADCVVMAVGLIVCAFSTCRIKL